MKFNINNEVKVKLTDFGRQIMKDSWESLCDEFPSIKKDGPRLCKEDSDGWSKWQLWTLMETFGPHISIGFNPPFETEIDIDIKPEETK